MGAPLNLRETIMKAFLLLTFACALVFSADVVPMDESVEMAPGTAELLQSMGLPSKNVVFGEKLDALVGLDSDVKTKTKTSTKKKSKKLGMFFKKARVRKSIIASHHRTARKINRAHRARHMHIIKMHRKRAAAIRRHFSKILRRRMSRRHRHNVIRAYHHHMRRNANRTRAMIRHNHRRTPFRLRRLGGRRRRRRRMSGH